MARILIVDDDPAVGHSLAAYLEDYDHQLTVCDDAESALRMAQAAPFDLAVVDLRLPGLNGEQLIQRLNARRQVERFLIHTGAVQYSPSAEMVKLGLGAAQVLYKPLMDLRLLLQAIDRELGADTGG